MEISVRTIGEVHSVLMGNFGIELTVAEAAELRRILSDALHHAPAAEPEVAIDQRTQVTEEDDMSLQFTVGPFFWFLSRENAEQLLCVLDDLVANASEA